MHTTRFANPLIALLATALLGSCATLDDALRSAPKPTARIIGADVRNISLSNLDLVFDIEITNPYGVQLPLIDISYVVGSGERQLLQGGVKPLEALPARRSSVIQLPARLDFAAVMQTLASVRPGSVLPYQAEINVAVDAPIIGAFNLPLKQEGEIPIPAVPAISLVSFDVSSMTREKVSATARLRVTNTNQFQIDVAALEFDLALGEQSLASARLRSSSRLAPGQSAILEVPLSFSPRAFADSIAGILLDLLAGNKADYGVSGSLDVGTRFGPLLLPFSQIGETDIRQ